MMTLPSITAAHLEREKKLTPEAMAEVIAYTAGEYATDAAQGPLRSRSRRKQMIAARDRNDRPRSRRS